MLITLGLNIIQQVLKYKGISLPVLIASTSELLFSTKVTPSLVDQISTNLLHPTV